MNDGNRENLKELFEKFLDAEQAESCVEDVQKAEEILREHPAPEPDDMLIANIKAEIAMRMPAGRTRRTGVFKQIAYKTVSVAAAVIFLTAIGLRLFDKGGVEPNGPVQYASIIPTAIWESDDIAAADANLAIFTVEIEQIENELLALQLGEDDGNGDRSITELEMELIEINNSDFWKG
jgi:hypothetical protein